MARKKDQPKPAARQVTSEKDLKSLLRAAKTTAAQAGELTASLREKIAYAVENKYLHRKAFTVTRGLDKLEPEQLNEFFDHFDHYCDVGGLRARAESAPAFEMEAEPEPEPEAEPVVDNSNISNIGRGRRQAAAEVG